MNRTNDDNSIYKSIKPIPVSYSRIGNQNNLYKTYKRQEMKENSLSRSSVFDRIPRVKISSDIYLDENGEEVKDYISSFRSRSPLIENFYSKKNQKVNNEALKDKEKDELKKRFDSYRKAKLKQVKEKGAVKERADIGRYNPNYNSIYSNIQTIRISQPVYQKELQLIFQKKLEIQKAEKEEYDKFQKKGNTSKREREREKKNFEVTPDGDLNNTIYKDKYIISRNYSKQISCHRDNKINHHTLNESSHSNSNSNNNHQSAKDYNNCTIGRKKNMIHNSFQSVYKTRGLSFDKSLGRENLLSLRRKKKEKMIDYYPNYDFILRNTKKTFVHYGCDKSNVRLRKNILTRKAIFNYKIDRGYSVVKIDQEEKIKKEIKSQDDKAYIYKLIGIQ